MRRISELEQSTTLVECIKTRPRKSPRPEWTRGSLGHNLHWMQDKHTQAKCARVLKKLHRLLDSMVVQELLEKGWPSRCGCHRHIAECVAARGGKWVDWQDCSKELSGMSQDNGNQKSCSKCDLHIQERNSDLEKHLTNHIEL